MEIIGAPPRPRSQRPMPPVTHFPASPIGRLSAGHEGFLSAAASRQPRLSSFPGQEINADHLCGCKAAPKSPAPARHALPHNVHR
jgi:hypothetical protein